MQTNDNKSEKKSIDAVLDEQDRQLEEGYNDILISEVYKKQCFRQFQYILEYNIQVILIF